MTSPRISARWRLALLAKALLLISTGLGLVGIGVSAAAQPNWIIRLLGGVFFAWLGAFVCWAGSLGVADAVVGETRTEDGVRVLENRRRGYSMRTPSGRFVEFILWNPWDALGKDGAYTVVYGRYSGVIVQQPQRTGNAPPMPTR